MHGFRSKVENKNHEKKWDQEPRQESVFLCALTVA